MRSAYFHKEKRIKLNSADQNYIINKEFSNKTNKENIKPNIMLILTSCGVLSSK